MTHALYKGLIANAEKGNEGDIQLVENLVSDYISRDSCLILLTITCECEVFLFSSTCSWYLFHYQAIS